MKQESALQPSIEVLSQLFKIEEGLRRLNDPDDDSLSKEDIWQALLNVVLDRFCSADALSLKEFMEHLERRLIVRMLFRANGNRKETAKLLGLKYTTLHEKLKKHNIHFKNMAY